MLIGYFSLKDVSTVSRLKFLWDPAAEQSLAGGPRRLPSVQEYSGLQGDSARLHDIPHIAGWLRGGVGGGEYKL